MRIVHVIAAVVALSIASTAFAEGTRCPKWEAGARYPWQSNTSLPGDRFAWLILNTDRSGFVIRCSVGKNNYANNEERFWLCKQYTDHWRAPPAAASDPDRRKFERYSLIAGNKHVVADRAARTAWFSQHPEERQECYPEPSRPDRMDL